MIVTMLGLAASLAVAAIAVAGAIALWRGGGSTALETLQTANRVLETRIHECDAEVAKLTAENAALRLRTDFAGSIAPLMVWAESHELNAAKRSDTMVNLLGLIADRLGAEPASAT